MNDNSSAATNPGWKRQDEWYLNRHDNVHTPETQILTEEDWEDEDKEQRVYWCAICHGKLDLRHMDMWYCNACVEYYDQKIQDIPIKDISESKVRVSAELQHYPTYEENDIWSPFIEAINPDVDKTDIPSNIEVVSDDGHHKHVRCKGMPSEALAAMNELDDK